MLNRAFEKVAKRQEGSSVLKLDRAICNERPDLEHKIGYFPEQGNSAFTLFFENEIFKGPKDKNQIRFIEQEYRVLQHLKGKGLRIPEVTTVGEDTVFFGMTRIQGLSMTRTWCDYMPAASQAAFAKEIAQFINDFDKAFTSEDAERLLTDCPNALPTKDDIIGFIKNPAVQSVLGDKLVDCCFYVDEYLKRMEGSRDIVAHLDLAPGNIMAEPDTNVVNGFIDFGYVGKTLPEVAFVLLNNMLSPPFVKMICDEYANESGGKMEYKDVLMLELVYGIEGLDKALRENKDNDVVFSKGAVTRAFEKLKKLEKPQTSPSPSAPFKP